MKLNLYADLHDNSNLETTKKSIQREGKDDKSLGNGSRRHTGGRLFTQLKGTWWIKQRRKGR